MVGFAHEMSRAVAFSDTVSALNVLQQACLSSTTCIWMGQELCLEPGTQLAMHKVDHCVPIFFNSTELPFPRDIFADTVPVMRNHAPVFTKLLLVNLRMIQGTVLSQLLLYIVPQLLINRDVQGMIVKQSTHNTVWPHLIWIFKWADLTSKLLPV